MLYLGFLKFLKRNKGKEPDLGLENMGDLDMPPEPPGVESEGFPEGEGDFGELPELPELPKSEEQFSEEEEPFPELDAAKKPSQEFKFPKLREAPMPSEKLTFPDYPRQTMPPKLEAGAGPEISRPRLLFGAQRPPIFSGQGSYEQKIEAPKQNYGRATPYQKFEMAAVKEEKNILKHKKAKTSMFIRVDRFREVLVGIKDIKNDLKIADESIARLNEIDTNRDKVFGRWYNVATDLQKKIIFVDNTLFKKQ